ncbi:hypothetical protein ASPZODRAFT_801256 [Penicilliopsis zonata CBS 506.65]|uniref:Uncharacterized protein n=1 Tax=Penicilliopsis zonata CBS 506.65 TaxID=1073090 RepID=A0A1L9SA00_9EURO|nr:hypothetical protein ASPZODRAFT_801256 [Penicilliopsis zonata CBS 506.65]OJJ43961.1 hypothetical protein ASPZODRAFT_801256 [Penicilliopsis zonata CBS 506.65]
MPLFLQGLFGSRRSDQHPKSSSSLTDRLPLAEPKRSLLNAPPQTVGGPADVTTSDRLGSPRSEKRSRPSNSPESDDLREPKEEGFLWQSIDPPAELMHSALGPARSNHQQKNSTASDQSLDEPASPTSLPGYSDVSGAVVVDWNGLPRFLDPQEEQERKEALQRAVRERMLGLPRTTEFNWAQPCHGDHLPEYSAGRHGSASTS